MLNFYNEENKENKENKNKLTITNIKKKIKFIVKLTKFLNI